MVNEFKDFEVQDEGSYDQGIPSLKEIVLRHISKIGEICCAEFTKGYWQDKTIKVAGGISVVSSYHEDNRLVYCNAMDFLVAIVYPNSDPAFTKMADGLTDDEDIDKRLKQRRNIFKEMNLMFKRTGYFDNMTGRTERTK